MATAIFPRYPHMGPMEAQIWHKFLATTDLKIININYDVRVGTGAVPKDIMDEYQRRLELYNKGLATLDYVKEYESIIKSITALTQLRIDVVAETPDEIFIIEVKPRAGRSALGQLESYHFWYLKQFSPTKPVRLAVVCIDVDRNVEPIFIQRGIRIFKVSV